MNIHINILWFHIEIDEIRYLVTSGDKTFVSLHHPLVKETMFHISAVDKEILMSTLLACRLWLANKS